MYKNDTKQYWDRTSQHQNQVLYSPTHKQESWVSSRQYLFLHLCQGLPMYSSLSTKNATKGYGYYIYYSYCCYYLNSLIHSYCCSLQLEHLNKHYYCCSPGLLEFNERQPAKEPVNQTSTTVLFLPLVLALGIIFLTIPTPILNQFLLLKSQQATQSVVRQRVRD